MTSHAVGLIAMQAAAGQVSWPHDPEAVGGRSEVIDATARSTLAELDRLGLECRSSPAGPWATSPSWSARIRATGTPVDLTVLGEPPTALGRSSTGWCRRR